MKKEIIKSGIMVLGGVYSVMKMFPQKQKVVFLSRQSDMPSQDICMLDEELKSRQIETKVLCKKMGAGIVGAAAYVMPMIRQMAYLATSKVAVLDSYCFPVSLFSHREGLQVIQMWHALGAMKKFGRSILDMPEGKTTEIAELMRMHKGYDYIFTSSEKSRPAFAEAFGYPEEKLMIMSLPRVDAILDAEANREKASEIREAYPQTAGKRNVVYAPTLRVGKDMTDAVEALISACDDKSFNLIIKMHPLTEIALRETLPENVIVDKQFSTSDMYSIADAVITDYSAITYEVALKGTPLYFYAFDKDEYMDGRTFYLDYDRDMPGPICLTAEELVAEIESDRTEEYRNKARAFAKQYIEKTENCTREIADFIESLLKKEKQ